MFFPDSLTRIPFISKENAYGINITWMKNLQKWVRGIPVQITTAQASIPTRFGTADQGTLVYVSDYAHQLIWTGTAFTWAPGELGSGFVVEFPDTPSPATGWQACDGSTVNKLNADGTISSVTVPNEAGKYYRL